MSIDTTKLVLPSGSLLVIPLAGVSQTTYELYTSASNFYATVTAAGSSTFALAGDTVIIDLSQGVQIRGRDLKTYYIIKDSLVQVKFTIK